MYSQDRLSGIHGLKNEKGEMHFEVSGYTISVYEVKGSVDDEGTLRLLEKAYGLNHILMTYTDSTLSMKNKIVESLIDAPGIPLQITQKCILLQKDNETITVLYLETSIKRDFVLEEEIVHACIDGQLSNYASNKKAALFMTLAGKKIDLPYGAEWVTPSRIVNEKSLIDWSEFSSVSRANQYLSNQINLDKVEGLEYIKENEIDVLFDGKPIKARRFVFHDPSNGLVFNYMITYYLVCELRGRYITCILSHYRYTPDDCYLPALLESVMHITSISKQMYTTFSDKKDGAKLSERLSTFVNSYFFELQLSSLMPLGDLREAYKVAPVLGVYLGFPVKKQMGIDAGIQLAIPVYSDFEYDAAGVTEYAKAMFQCGVNLRWRYQMKPSKDIYCFNYLGAGVAWFFIDIEWDPELVENHHIKFSDSVILASLDLFGGFNVRYKKLGLFAEYHYIPYGNKNKISYEFGSNSVNLGFSFAGFLN